MIVVAENAVASCIGDVLRPFLREHEKVFLCSFQPGDRNLTDQSARAVEMLGGQVMQCSEDRRWYSLLRQVFTNRAAVLIGLPGLVLGLAKVARVTGTPLPVRHVVLLGNVSKPWLLKGIRDSLDAEIHICNLPAEAYLRKDHTDFLLEQLDEQLLSWSSILDYRASRTQQGLCLEILTFPGRQLPHLPSGARVTVRSWNPRTDIPFCLRDG